VTLLPEIDSQGTAGMAEKLRLAVANLALPHTYSPIADHISVFVGHATRQADPDQSPQDVLKQRTWPFIKPRRPEGIQLFAPTR